MDSLRAKRWVKSSDWQMNSLVRVMRITLANDEMTLANDEGQH
jgi:hypothetical protein